MNTIRKTAVAAFISLAAVGATGLSATSATASSAVPSASHQADARHAGHRAPGRAVFVQDDNPSGNRVHVYDRTSHGGLTRARTYATGGKGGALDGAVVDNLASQGSLIYDRASRLLYVVNAGSNTVSVFEVHGDRLVRRQVISSGGDFPVSIAVHKNHVFVLNARDGGSITGFRKVKGRLRPTPNWNRDLGLDPNQTPEFTSTAAQVGFSPDGSKLVVTTKNGGNSVEVFPFGQHGPAQKPTVTSLPGTVPFGFDFDPAGHLVLTEAAPSAVVTYAIATDGSLTQLDMATTGQTATCWVTDVRGTEYASNTGSGTVSIFNDDRHGVLTYVGREAAHAGTVDAAASSDGRFLYVQGGAAGVVDSYRIRWDGSLASTGSVKVPGAVGAEGIAAS